jgi:hypothetical protein
MDYLLKQPGIERVFEIESLYETVLPAKLKEMVANGYFLPQRGYSNNPGAAMD